MAHISERERIKNDWMPEAAVPQSSVVVFDDDRAVYVQTEVAPSVLPARRRGRPVGTKAKVSHQRITADEIAFLRAVVQGIDIRICADHYLYVYWPGRPPERGALIDTLTDLVLRVELAAASLPDADMATNHVETLKTLREHIPANDPDSVAMDASEFTAPIDLLDLPDALKAPAPKVSARKQPTLEEFACQFDVDMYSERELIDLYKEEFGDEADAATSPGQAVEDPSIAMAMSHRVRIESQLSAIDWLNSCVAVRPRPQDYVGQWLNLSGAQMQALREGGVLSLQNLSDWIVLTGRRWFERIPRYGRERAHRLEKWLAQSLIKPSQGLPDLHVRSSSMGLEIGLDKPGAKAVQRPISAGLALVEALDSGNSVHALAPLAQMTWPIDLQGGEGGFRGQGKNTLNASTDLQAVQAWFAMLVDHSEQTQIAYRRAVERLMLWAVHERKTALSALTAPDLLDFRAFLKSPPAHWIQKGPRLKTASDWRPLRGPLNEKSLQLTHAAISAMFKAWRASGYINANPYDTLPGPRRSEIQMDVMRSFSEQDVDVIRLTMTSLKEGPIKRRLIALFSLLQTAGLRRAEAVNANWGDLERIRIDGSLSDNWALRLIGKGKKERVIPIVPSTIAALDSHRNDRLEMMFSSGGPLSVYKDIDPEKMPLIGILNENLAAFKGEEIDQGHMPHTAERQANETGGLSSARMYTILKDFFRKCDKNADSDNSDFSKASTHWLRHTFAHDALKSSGKDLGVVQQLLGHASITTTTIYTKADMTMRVAALENIRTIF